MRCTNKLAFFLAGTSLGVGLFSAALAGRIIRLALDEEIEEKGRALARVSAELLIPRVIDREALAARASLREIVQRNAGTRYAFIVGFEGKLLAQTFEGGFPRGLAMETLGRAPASIRTVKRYRTTEGDEILQVCQPLIAGMPALIVFGLDLRQVREHVAAVQHLILAGALGISVVGILAGVLLGLRITRPLKELAGAIASYGSGKKDDLFVPRGHCDEVVELAAAFNGMIAERKLVESALRTSEEYYQSMFEDSPTALLEMDLSEIARSLQLLVDGGVTDFAAFFEERPEEVQRCISLARVLNVNQAALRLYRADTKEPLLHLPEKALTPKALAVYRMALVTLAQGKTTFSGELAIRAVDGTDLSVYQQWLVMPGHERDYSRVLVSISDLTSQRQAEEYVRTVLQTIDEGFITLDRELRILSANRAFLEQVGRSEAQVLGKKCREVLHHVRRPCSEESDDCPARKVLVTGLAQRCCHVHIGPGGKESLFEIKAYPLRDALGRIVSVIETFTDITNKRLLEGGVLEVDE